MEKSLIIEAIEFFANEYDIIFDNSTYDDSKRYVIKVLDKTKKLNEHSLDLICKIETLKERIKALQSGFVTGDSYDGVMGGKNTGLRGDKIQKLYNKRMKLQDELVLLQDELEDNYDSNDLPNKYARVIIENCLCDHTGEMDTILSYYMHNKSVGFIADKKGITDEAVQKRKERGIKNISKNLEEI